MKDEYNLLKEYNKIRRRFKNEDGEKHCYCGHTDYCSCGNPGQSEYYINKERIDKHVLKFNIDENN